MLAQQEAERVRKQAEADAAAEAAAEAERKVQERRDLVKLRTVFVAHAQGRAAVAPAPRGLETVSAHPTPAKIEVAVEVEMISDPGGLDPVSRGVSSVQEAQVRSWRTKVSDAESK